MAWEAGDKLQKKKAGQKVHRVCIHNSLRPRTGRKRVSGKSQSYSIYTDFKL